MSELVAEIYNVSHVLSVFDNETDELIAEYSFAYFDLVKFKRHFGISDEDEDSKMYFEYVVAPKDTNFLLKNLDDAVNFDFEKYAYFVSCYRVYKGKQDHILHTWSNKSLEQRRI